jgi:uroporphyrinogen-III decarboxylase
MPIAERSPFQFALIDYLGEGNVFYALADEPERMARLLAQLDEWMTNALNRLAEFDAPYVELVDNLDGTMTSPPLFQQHVIPYYQRYADILHAQGKKLGCHADGNLRPILHLLPESGLDVCESFSPHPLTPCTFDEAWQAWKNGPLIWGGIPSPILEERTSEQDFRQHVARLLETIGDRPIILGIGDLVLENNLIERVRYIAEQVEAHPPGS